MTVAGLVAVTVAALVAVTLGGGGVALCVCVGAEVSLGASDGMSVTVGSGVSVPAGVLVDTFGTRSRVPALMVLLRRQFACINCCTLTR